MDDHNLDKFSIGDFCRWSDRKRKPIKLFQIETEKKEVKEKPKQITKAKATQIHSKQNNIVIKAEPTSTNVKKAITKEQAQAKIQSKQNVKLEKAEPTSSNAKKAIEEQAHGKRRSGRIRKQVVPFQLVTIKKEVIDEPEQIEKAKAKQIQSKKKSKAKTAMRTRRSNVKKANKRQAQAKVKHEPESDEDASRENERTRQEARDRVEQRTVKQQKNKVGPTSKEDKSKPRQEAMARVEQRTVEADSWNNKVGPTSREEESNTRQEAMARVEQRTDEQQNNKVGPTTMSTRTTRSTAAGHSVNARPNEEIKTEPEDMDEEAARAAYLMMQFGFKCPRRRIQNQTQGESQKESSPPNRSRYAPYQPQPHCSHQRQSIEDDLAQIRRSLDLSQPQDDDIQEILPQNSRSSSDWGSDRE